MNSVETPTTSRSSSSRSQCYHKLPDHAVRLMQEWSVFVESYPNSESNNEKTILFNYPLLFYFSRYNANLDNPYPRTPDKKRFITEGHITAQQCRSWFANRRQRMKHVKRNQPKSVSSRSTRFVQTKFVVKNNKIKNLSFVSFF